MKDLFDKYNVAAPRYTSYPTVPYWDKEVPAQEDWKKLVRNTFVQDHADEGMSLYIHLPFCESLCTYCGCNTRITVNHKVESPYIAALLKEWSLYVDLFGRKPLIREIHLGGGTPTFFSAENLHRLMEGIFASAVLAPDAELSFEGHPDNTSVAHLETLRKLGFQRISLGIQDFDPKVQRIINRIQDFETVKHITQEAREMGYTSINYDLIYGLPLQTRQSMVETIEKVIALEPDRIAFYSYAHVPWLKPGQRMFTEADLPAGKEKRALYELGRQLLEGAGYLEIGMDHFAKPADPLHAANNAGSLHRNFMGYTASRTRLLVGLGASSISDGWLGFVQNEKKVEDYYRKLDEGVFPFFKGHLLSREDAVLRKHILNVMCRQQTTWETPEDQCASLHAANDRLAALEADGLIHRFESGLKVTPLGKSFLRNICLSLDAKYWAVEVEGEVFSGVS